MKKETPDDIIQDYLKGKYSPAERDTFEKTLETEPELAAELQLRRAEMAASEWLIASETRAKFQEWQPQNSSQRGVAGFTSLLWLSGIAAGLLLFAAILFIKQPAGPAASTENTPPPTEQRLPQTAESPAVPPPVAVISEKQGRAPLPAKDYFALAKQLLPAPVLSNLRQNPADSATSVYRQAELAFAAGDYQNTLNLLAKTDSTRWQSAAFLSAHALFRERRLDAAEKKFELLVVRDSRQYRYPAEWGLLMCRLAGLPEREKVFRNQLEDMLSKPQHPYFEQAKTLKMKIN